MNTDTTTSFAELPHGEALARPGEAEAFTVTAPDGVRLAAQSWGNPAGPPFYWSTVSASAT